MELKKASKTVPSLTTILILQVTGRIILILQVKLFELQSIHLVMRKSLKVGEISKTHKEDVRK
jgi:hypothetical protein